MVDARTALEWRARYEAGATIEQIALDVGTYDSKVRKALHEVGTQMRRASGAPKNRPTHVPKGAHDAVVHHAFRGAKAVHRRRGR